MEHLVKRNKIYRRKVVYHTQKRRSGDVKERKIVTFSAECKNFPMFIVYGLTQHAVLLEPLLTRLCCACVSCLLFYTQNEHLACLLLFSALLANHKPRQFSR